MTDQTPTTDHDDRSPVPDGTPEQAGQDEQLTQSQQLVRIAQARYRFGRTEDGRPYAQPADGAPIATAFRGSKDSMRQELAAAFLGMFGKPPSSTALAESLTALEGLALQQEPTDLHLRVARQPDGTIALDLGRADGRTVVIGPDGWHVTTSPDVTWRRTALTAAMPDPVGGGDPFALAELVNVPDDALPLLLAWCVAALVPDVPHPIMLLLGEQGTGKSVAAKTIARLLDPSPAPLRSAPRTSDDWAVAAGASWVVPLDNLSSVPAWFSDVLCRGVTGDANLKRALYTDDDVAVLAFQRVIMLTSIDSGALKGDLAERLVVLDLERLGDQRATEADLADRWREAHPHLLGALLDLLVATLDVLPDVHLDQLPRMADYARIVAAVDQVLGTDALGTYLDQSDRLASDVLDADPVAAALLDVLEADPFLEEPASEILDRLDLARGDARAPKDWPTTPRGMAGALKRLAPALREQGVEVDYLGPTGHDRTRLWRLDRHGEHAKQPTAPTAPTADEPAQAPDEDGANGADGEIVGLASVGASAPPHDGGGQPVVPRGTSCAVCSSTVDVATEPDGTPKCPEHLTWEASA